MNVKFLKNLTEAWQQVVVHLQMTHNLRSQGLHDLYRMMVQHEEFITGKAKKTDAVALFSKHGEGAHSKGLMQMRDVNPRDEASFIAYSSESDEDVRKMNQDMALMARDIRNMKAAKKLWKL